MSSVATEPVVYTLKYPVELKSREGSVVETVTELTFKRLNGGDARKALNAKDKGMGEMVMVLVCASAGIPPSTFDKLDAEDVFKAQDIASDFFGLSLPT